MTTKLATFKIDDKKWEQFKNKAGNASRVLTKFIDLYLDGDIDFDRGIEKAKDNYSIDDIGGIDDKIDERVRVVTESAIASLKSEIAMLREEFLGK